MKFQTARPIIVVVIGILVSTGCATDYEARGLKRGFLETQFGFSETQFTENVFQVRFEGNEYTSMERATDFTLLRSAEISLQHGSPYFVILDVAQHVDTSTITTPPTANTTFHVTGSPSFASGAATTTYHSGGEITVSEKPSATNTIACLKVRPADGTFVYEAALVHQSIRTKYGLDVKNEAKRGPKGKGSINR